MSRPAAFTPRPMRCWRSPAVLIEHRRRTARCGAARRTATTCSRSRARDSTRPRWPSPASIRTIRCARRCRSATRCSACSAKCATPCAAYGCTRAILVGHNAAFDLGFLNAAVARADVKRNPVPPVLLLRHRDAGRRGARPDGARQGGDGGRARVGRRQRALRAYDAERTAESSASCATACATVTRRPRSARAHSAGRGTCATKRPRSRRWSRQPLEPEEP